MNKILQTAIASIASNIKKDANKIEGATLLVTGGAGFLCSYFLDVVNYLNENQFDAPCKVITLDNFITGKNDNIAHLMDNENFQFVTQDISKQFKLKDNIDYVIHGASIASPITYRKYPLETIDVNVAGTRNLLELAKEKNVKSFLYLGTSEVYGDPFPQFIPTPETYLGNVSCTGPRACYDESKRLAETLCMIYREKFNVPVKITRTFNAYGPRLSINDKRVIPDFAKDSLDGKQIVMYSDGTPTRSFCYVSDNISAQFSVLLSDFNGEVFNVGNNEQEISMRDLAEKIRKIAGNPNAIKFAKNEDKAYTTDNPQRRCPNIDKIKKMIGWTPKVSLDSGLTQTINWYKENYYGD
ncbi:MAG: NAD-dependent epimerase/dehydratase family protein [Candidatus Micrarchaeota archaeon]